MRKLITVLAAFVLLFSVIQQPNVKAASVIQIIIDGQVLPTDQPPVEISGRTLVPLRGIFEALKAKVVWNEKLQTITATRGDTTIVLKLGSKTATVNNKTITLDVPARTIKYRTMVPVRFVSEALGDDVNWNSKTQTVNITTLAGQGVGAAASVIATSIGQNGDGRDLRVSFTPPSNQTNVNSYRILVVKEENASSFNLAKAQIVGAANYTTLANNMSTTTLSTLTKDVDGALIRAKQAYRVFVLTVGNDLYALSGSSASVTLNGSPSVNAATNVTINDNNDFGDGRDLTVSFTKASNDSNITGYRVMIVKTTDASKFDLAAANGVSSSFYNTVSKTSASTLSFVFNANSKDTSGALIKNGVAYTAFVLSLSNNTGALSNGLSAASASLLLATSAQVPFITNVSDINNYGDGRDLQVTFNKSADESRIGYYRVFVVREADYSSFNVTEANKLTSDKYFDISKTGASTYSPILTSSSKDTKGNYITTGVAYRVFVMGVTNNSAAYASVLSVASSSVSLTNTGVNAVTNLVVSDVTDYNSALDLRVAFTKATNENNISQYRVFVVKEANASSFSLATASAITNSSYYYVIAKTGGNIIRELSSNTLDVNGAAIQNGVSYRVFVLSVGTGNTAANNALSSPSLPITLTNSGVTAATSVVGTDVADNNNGLDLNVSFTKAANESNIGSYRIYVVKDAYANNFTLAVANSIASNYTVWNKNGANHSKPLAADSRDIDGVQIQSGVSYRIFIMSVGIGSSNGTNVLSVASPAITLVNSGVVTAVTNLNVSDTADNNNGSDLRVSFTKPANEINITQYRVFVVKDAIAGAFNLTAASAITNPDYYTVITKTGGDINTPLTAGSRDTNGELVKNGVSYRVFVLSVGGGSGFGTNALSTVSPLITLSTTNVAAVTNVAVSDNGQGLKVTFNKAADESNIQYYRVSVVQDVYASSYDPVTALSNSYYVDVPKSGSNNIDTVIGFNMRDSRGELIKNGVNYFVFVLSVGNPGLTNALSSLSNIVVPTSAPAIVGVSGATTLLGGTNNQFISSRQLEGTLPSSFFRRS
ncbi:copper amine oxidase N-terminal domain-containing protein [Cohnella sp. WQ 127256]|uniref:copper amine oxidase N-terminal domain-containing protein n=1 Tax=Cohnella sp. WQ 127256 TaxID=2938790 RepID=UPI0021190D00|nr:copper amine oxidase N-terminal domain-containing protein [Cohnella sp. WQ 127256]